MEIYIVRHGETIWNEKGLLQGSKDIELNESGRELAQKTGVALADVPFDIIYCSPLKRAYETAKLIRHHQDTPIIKAPLLKELDFGDFEGQSLSLLMNDEDCSFKHFFNAPHLYVPPANGETLESLINRASTIMSETIEPLAKTKKRIMIVAHGALNKAIMTHIKKHDIEAFWSGGLQSNCNVIIVDYSNEQYKILNETKTFY